MRTFSKVIAVLSIVSVVVIAILFVFDLVQAEEMRDMLRKILLTLALVALGGFGVSVLAQSK
jgi:hypothetical protein